MRGTQRLVCFTAVICVVTQREDEWEGALRDDKKNGCEAADYPTTECFQICQKCLKWFSVCVRSLFDYLELPEKLLFS